MENRCRFGLMVLEEIRARPATGFIVGIRYVIDEDEAGLTLQRASRWLGC
jgi:2,4-dienoyl-CoA reductase-like NADH-dependent reductase (Old Yellow Enzyme family)